MSGTVECVIEKLVHGGDGLARVEGGDGRKLALFVSGVLAGERVSVAIEPARHGRQPARLLRVLEPSPDRVAPGCEYFSRCGGCQWQHIRPEAQREAKKAILLESLARLGQLAWSGPVEVHAGEPWSYRSRIRLQVTAAGRAGYFEAHSHRVLPVSHCPIASPRLNEALGTLTSPAAVAALASATTNGAAAGTMEIELATDERDAGLTALGAPAAALAADAELLYTCGAHRYRVSPGAFFQVNRYLTPALVAAAVGEAKGERAIDLFSGVGLFALPLADHLAEVEAVEAHPGTFADLQFNCAAAGNRIRPVHADALAYLRTGGTTADLVVADPPRSGLGGAACAALLARAPARIHLVACDPASLARDLATLVKGGYEIESLQLFDLFPQTWHLETVAHLRRR